MISDFDRNQRRLRERVWTWADMPFYDGPGTRPDIQNFHELDYLDVYERVYGRPIGANGIGRLREAALVSPTAGENRIWEDDVAAALLERHGMAQVPDLDSFRREHEAYAGLLESEGVTVHWIDEADAPPHRSWTGHDLLIAQGGAIVSGGAWNPYALGNAERLARWAFWNLNIPTLITISGSAVADAGATLWLAADVYVVGLSIAYDDDGLAQLVDVVRLTSGVADLEVLTVRCQGNRYLDRQTGASAHVNNVIAPLDAGKLLCHPAGIDTATLLWLRKHDYDLIEVDPEDQVLHLACDILLLEPGHVVMPSGARRTIERLRAARVEVTPAPAENLTAAGTGLRSATMEIHREPGPARFTG